MPFLPTTPGARSSTRPGPTSDPAGRKPHCRFSCSGWWLCCCCSPGRCLWAGWRGARGGAQRIAELAAAVRRPIGRWVLVLAAVATLAQAYPLASFTPGSRFPGASLGRAVAGGACVISDDPAALIEMNVLGRNLATGAGSWPASAAIRTRSGV